MPQQHYRTATYRSHESVGYLVRRLYTLLRARLEDALAHEGCTLTQWIVLVQLHEGRVRTASDIAQDLQYDSGALTRLLDQLEVRGFVVRRRLARDRRVVELELTTTGRDRVRAMLPIVVDQTNAALAPLTRAEFAQMREYLQRILQHVEGGAGGPPPTAPKRVALPKRTARRGSASAPKAARPSKRKTR